MHMECVDGLPQHIHRRRSAKRIQPNPTEKGRCSNISGRQHGGWVRSWRDDNSETRSEWE